MEGFAAKHNGIHIHYFGTLRDSRNHRIYGILRQEVDGLVGICILFS